jgi:hypothetical protein
MGGASARYAKAPAIPHMVQLSRVEGCKLAETGARASE